MALIAGVQYSGNPVGAILPCATNSALPMTLLCNGSAVSRVTYSALFAAIGTTYGAGDGSTTFNVPNLQGVFPRGAGTQNRYTFTVTSANATAGATYTNNSQTFTVLNTISGSTTLITNGTGAPLASGTLTRASGTGDNTITFSANSVVVYSGTLGNHVADQFQGHFHQLAFYREQHPNGSGSTEDEFTNTTTTTNVNVRNPVTDGVNGNPRTGSETAPVHLVVNYCIAF